MSELTEIRWHGRGGQGAKTAALLLADVAFQAGKQVQGFPEYGPEWLNSAGTAAVVREQKLPACFWLMQLFPLANSYRVFRSTDRNEWVHRLQHMTELVIKR